MSSFSLTALFTFEMFKISNSYAIQHFQLYIRQLMIRSDKVPEKVY